MIKSLYTSSIKNQIFCTSSQSFNTGPICVLLMISFALSGSFTNRNILAVYGSGLRLQGHLKSVGRYSSLQLEASITTLLKIHEERLSISFCQTCFIITTVSQTIILRLYFKRDVYSSIYKMKK